MDELGTAPDQERLVMWLRVWRLIFWEREQAGEARWGPFHLDLVGGRACWWTLGRLVEKTELEWGRDS